jgi:putative membrane protein
MIIRKHLDPRIILRVGRRRIATLLILSTLVYLLYAQFGNRDVVVSTVPASILGVVIAFLIGFRVNSAYERWWEARKIWGGLVNDSRNFARQVMTFINTHWNPELNEEEAATLRRDLIYGQIGFVYALKNTLRRQDIIQETKPFFSIGILARLQEEKHIPNAILLRQAQLVQAAVQSGHTEDFRHMQFDNTFNRLSDWMGASERIKNTVFPRQYSYYSTLFTTIYSYLLPFILVQETGWMVIPFTVLIGFIFFALDGIANGIENPFENSINDTPMSAICRTIEINLRQMLGEKELPEPVQPVNGFLY